MSDVMRDACKYYDTLGCAIYRKSATAALDAERTEHAKQVANLNKKHAKERDEINKDRSQRCACRFISGTCISSCAYHTLLAEDHAKEVADLKKQLEVARESLSWYEIRDIMRQTSIEKEEKP